MLPVDFVLGLGSGFVGSLEVGTPCSGNGNQVYTHAKEGRTSKVEPKKQNASFPKEDKTAVKN